MRIHDCTIESNSSFKLTTASTDYELTRLLLFTTRNKLTLNIVF